MSYKKQDGFRSRTYGTRFSLYDGRVFLKRSLSPRQRTTAPCRFRPLGPQRRGLGTIIIITGMRHSEARNIAPLNGVGGEDDHDCHNSYLRLLPGDKAGMQSHQGVCTEFIPGGA